MPSDNVISATRLSAGYKDKIIWQNASFNIRRGSFVGVLGPNGAGKTTLFKLLLGLKKPLSGRIDVLGVQSSKGNPKIGYVPQRRIAEEDFNIEALEIVRLGLNNTKLGFSLPTQSARERAKAYEALGWVDADDLAHRAIGSLSGGELQRIFLAQALVGNPTILLLDEPLANLDVKREMELIRLISKVSKERRVTVLLIAHDINPLIGAVDSLIYLVNGKIATGSPKDILTSQKLSKLYGANVEVLKDRHGRLAVIGTEEAAHHD